MKFVFQKAATSQSKARLTLIGPSGSGKTYSALKVAQGLGQRVAVIDTENASAAKYADEFDFHVLCMDEFSPQNYIRAIRAAEEAGFDVVIIDSLSHAWIGKGGALEMVNKAEKRYHGNSFAAWRDVTPHHNALVDAIVRSNCHLIATMRAKTDYVIETDDKGRKVPRKIGLAPVQRDGIEYEFDIVADMDLEHNMIIHKTRCRGLDGKVFHKPGQDVSRIILDWLQGNAPATVDQVVTPAPAPVDVAVATATVATESKPAPHTAPQPEAAPEPVVEAVAEAAPQPEVEAAPKEAPQPVAEAQLAPAPEPEPQPEPQVAAEEPQPAVEAAEAQPEPKPEPKKTKAKKAAPTKPAKKAAPKKAAKAAPTLDDAWKSAAMALMKTAREHFNGEHSVVLDAIKHREGVATSKELTTERLTALTEELNALAAEGRPSMDAQLVIWRQMLAEPSASIAI